MSRVHDHSATASGKIFFYISAALLSLQLIASSCNAWIAASNPYALVRRPLEDPTGTGRFLNWGCCCTSRQRVATRRPYGVQACKMTDLSGAGAIGDRIRRVDEGETAETLVNKYDTFIFDCDGVLWGGSHAIEGSLDTVKALRRAGKRTFFVTNNSSKSRRQYCLKLEGFGVYGVAVEDVITSGSAIAAYIKHELPEVKAVYMVGDVGLEEELGMVGLRCVREEDRPAAGMSEDQFREAKVDAEVGAVIVGYDVCFGFRQICMASLYIQEGATFLGTNPDVADRVGTRLIPGTGPLLAAIASASGVTPVVVGKPNPVLIRRLMDDYGLVASRTLMVGDRLDTDIMFGNAGGVSTALVLTGVSQIGEVSDLLPGGSSTPTYLMENLGVLLPSAQVAADSIISGVMAAEQSSL